MNEALAWQIFSSDIALITSSNLKQYHRNSNLNLKIHFHLFLPQSDHNGRRKILTFLGVKNEINTTVAENFFRKISWITYQSAADSEQICWLLFR